jgi:hypothetical protein
MAAEICGDLPHRAHEAWQGFRIHIFPESLGFISRQPIDFALDSK